MLNRKLALREQIIDSEVAAWQRLQAYLNQDENWVTALRICRTNLSVFDAAIKLREFLRGEVPTLPDHLDFWKDVANDLIEAGS
jgi:hypothetical protein